MRDDLTGSSLDPDRSLVWRCTLLRAPELEMLQGATVFGEMEPANRAGVDATGECLGRSGGDTP